MELSYIYKMNLVERNPSYIHSPLYIEAAILNVYSLWLDYLLSNERQREVDTVQHEG